MTQKCHFWVNTPKELKAESWDICTAVFAVALFIGAETGKQHKCLLANERISKLRYIHTMEYYLALKWKEIL